MARFHDRKFREFVVSGGLQQEDFAAGNFHESANFRKNSNIFLHMKISRFTVIVGAKHNFL